jgi:hypothetical protein
MVDMPDHPDRHMQVARQQARIAGLRRGKPAMLQVQIGDRGAV